MDTENDKGNIPPEVRERLDDDDPATEQIWTALQASDERRARSFSVDAAWQDLADRLAIDSSASAQEAAAEDRQAGTAGLFEAALATLVGGRMRLAVAAVAVLCAVGLGAWWWSQPVTVATAAGEQTTVTLPDGSTAELSSATKIDYPRGFTTLPLVGSPDRHVTLDGEAYFTVEEDASPFTVTTPNASIEVLGTRFNVRAISYEDEVETEVTLDTGQLRLTARDGPSGAAVELTESNTLSRVHGAEDPTRPAQVDLDHVTAWRAGGFAMQGAALTTILREMERRFDAQLDLRVPAEETETMTLHYGEEVQLEDLLNDIALVQNLKYRETSQGYELVRDE